MHARRVACSISFSPRKYATSSLSRHFMLAADPFLNWLMETLCFQAELAACFALHALHCMLHLAAKENATCLSSRRLTALTGDMLPSECAREVVRPAIHILPTIPSMLLLQLPYVPLCAFHGICPMS